MSLFFGSFTTLLAVINPFESLPVFLTLTRDRDERGRRNVAMRACLYTLFLSLFFLFFGATVLELFSVSLPMVQIAGGIVLTKIGFELFLPSKAKDNPFTNADPDANIAFMPLAMPLMFGPGVIATVLGMMGTIRESSDKILSYAAIIGAFFIDYRKLRPMRTGKYISKTPAKPVSAKSADKPKTPDAGDSGDDE